VAGEGIQVEIATNAPQLGAFFRVLVDEQIPFAGSVALTRLAQDVKVAEADDFPHRMKTHGERLARGLRVRRAEKRDWPKSTSAVGTIDDFLVLQEFGGTKRAQKGASHVAIPAAYVDARRRPTTGRFPSVLLPRKIPKSHKVEGQAIRANVRVAGGGSSDRVFWFLRRSVHIKPRLRFRETAQKTAAAKYGAHFERELSAAIRSARVRAGRFTSEQGRFFYRKALASL
jgi:hypothetical protein